MSRFLSVAVVLGSLAATLGSRAFGAVAPRIAILGVTNAVVTLAVSGEAGLQLGAEASTNLASWVPVTAVAAAAETAVFEHRVPGETGPIFFRATAAEPERLPALSGPLEPVVLPLDVLGAEPTERTVEVVVPPDPGILDATNLVFEGRIYGLDYADKATLAINDGFSLALNNRNVRLPARQAAYGGIGGMYSTLNVKVPLPPGVVRPGVNRVRFVFNGTDGDSIGFRVLRFNFLRGSAELVSPEQFVEDDPSRWNPPGDPPDIAQGRTLWRNRELVTSSLPDAVPMRARCADCHVDDGYDLRYFNFSNLSIIERSKFHGLTEDEGRQVAAYIRSLGGPAPGRPWNPPYQPGPGLDSKPVSEWAAGAGLDAVLAEDRDTYAYLFPGGEIPRTWDLARVTNIREIPVALELPVWNLWLPKIHPLDYYGARFEGGKIDSEYRKAVAAMRATRGKSVEVISKAWSGYLAELANGFAQAFTNPKPILDEPAAVGAEAIRQQSLGRYGIHQWRLVKTWEFMRHHELEGLGQALRDAGRYPNPPSPSKEVPERTWLGDGHAFRTAPHTARLPARGHGIRDGSLNTWNYISFAWYYLQLILDDNHRRGDGAVHWPYMTAFTKLNSNREVFGAMRAVTLFKGMEAHYNSYRLTNRAAFPWSLTSVRLDLFSPRSPSGNQIWDQTPVEIWRPMVASYLRAHVARSRFFPVSEYRAAYPISFSGQGVASLGLHADSLYDLPQWYWSLVDFKQRGVDPEAINDAVDLAKEFWPMHEAEWEKLRTPLPDPVPVPDPNPDP